MNLKNFFFPGAMNIAYGFKNYPLNGPFPRDIAVVKNGSALRISYDQPFTMGDKPHFSGFFYCCAQPPSLCDSNNYQWPVLPKSRVSANESQLTVDVELAGSPLCPGWDRPLPYWFGYAYSNAPFRLNYGASIYGVDEFRTPANSWRYDSSSLIFKILTTTALPTNLHRSVISLVFMPNFFSFAQSSFHTMHLGGAGIFHYESVIISFNFLQCRCHVVEAPRLEPGTREDSQPRIESCEWLKTEPQV